MRGTLWLLLCALLAGPAGAEGVQRASYELLRAELDGLATFETLPRRDEPGINLQAPVRVAGLWIGEHLAGQSVLPRVAGLGVPHDALARPQAHWPLAVRPGRRDRNLAVAHHRGLGSNALFPLGPRGFHDIAGRGEGAVALVFDIDQAALGFRLHAAYDDALGGAQARGRVEVSFFTRGGNRIGHAVLRPGPGPQAYGFRRPDNRRDVAGIVITNTDPGGIALDDFLFQIEQHLF